MKKLMLSLLLSLPISMFAMNEPWEPMTSNEQWEPMTSKDRKGWRKRENCYCLEAFEKVNSLQAKKSICDEYQRMIRSREADKDSGCGVLCRYFMRVYEGVDGEKNKEQKGKNK